MAKIRKTKPLVEQHIHGGFGIDFAVTDTDGIIDFAKKITDYGVGGFYPTLATDSVENLQRQIKYIKEAMRLQKEDSIEGAKLMGVNLEACFLNPLKKGIHNEEQLLPLTVENYQLLEDEVIKIVTIAPELDDDGKLCRYLKSKGVNVSAGHCLGTDLSNVDQVTHMYNAMGEFSHKNPSTVVSALSDSNLPIELIADLCHVQRAVVEMTFKLKPHNKIILISDALPIAHSNLESMTFCSKTVYLNDGKAVDEKGTMAGSTMFVYDIIKQLVKENILDFETAVKMANFDEVDGEIFWDENLNIIRN